MRTIRVLPLALAFLSFLIQPLMAAPAALPLGPNATPLDHTPLLHKAQSNYYGGFTYGWGWGWGYNYIPACPWNYHYSCWNDPAYGYRHCGCWPNGAFFGQ